MLTIKTPLLQDIMSNDQNKSLLNVIKNVQSDFIDNNVNLLENLCRGLQQLTNCKIALIAKIEENEKENEP